MSTANQLTGRDRLAAAFQKQASSLLQATTPPMPHVPMKSASAAPTASTELTGRARLANSFCLQMRASYPEVFKLSAVV